MNKSKITGMGFSILIHTFLLFLILYHLPRYIQTAPVKVKSIEVTLKIIETKKKILPTNDVQTVPIVQNPNAITQNTVEPIKEVKKAFYETDPIICKDKDKNYIGVGFVWQPGTNMITRVPMGLPAYEAGIRLGDLFVDATPPSPAGYIIFTIQRGYDLLRFNIKEEKICYQEG